MEKCPDCGKECKSPQSLRGHRALKHGGLSGAPPAGERTLRQPLSGDQEKFHALLEDCDVKKDLDTISRTFFAGDPR